MTVEYDDGERLRRIGTRIDYGQRTVLETPNGLWVQRRRPPERL